MFKDLFKYLSLLAVAALFSAAAVYAADWTEPSVNPPAGNVDQPVNVGSSLQIKSGSLGLDNKSSLYIKNGKLILGNGIGEAVLTQGVRLGQSATGLYDINLPPAKASGSGQALMVDSILGDTVNLKFDNVAANNINDPDWSYHPDQNNPTAIYSTRYTIVGGSYFAPTFLNSPGAGDFYIKNRFSINDNFNVDSSGVLQKGSVPWGRLKEFPAACANGQYVTGIGQTITCGTPTVGISAGNGAVLFANNGVIDGNSSNLFWSSSLMRLGVMSNNPQARLEVQAAGNAETVRIVGGSSFPLRITDSSNVDIFTINSVGKLTTGIVPWANLETRPGLCAAGKIATGVNADGSIQCSFVFDLAMPGINGQTLRHDGVKWLANSFLFNDGTKVMIKPDAQPAVGGFVLESNGHVGPHQDNTYDLGSAAYRWANIFMGGKLNLAMTPGSVLFIDDQGNVAENNNGLFWDNAINRLKIGGSLNIRSDSNTGQLYFDDQLFMHNSYNKNVFIGQDGPQIANLFDNTESTVVLGYGAFASLENSSDSIAIGADVARSAQAAFGIIAIGPRAMSGLVDGGSSGQAYNNLALGVGALSAIVSNGTENVAIGNSSLQNIAGSSNTAIGYRALQGSSLRNVDKNTIIGAQAAAGASPSRSVLIGFQSGLANAGNYNVLIGNESGAASANGSNNVYIGNLSGKFNAGSGNVFLGNLTGQDIINNSNLLIVDNELRSGGNSSIDNALLYGQFQLSGDPYLKINGDLRVRDDYFASDGSRGLTITSTVKDKNGLNCSLTFKNGLLTASTCAN